MAGDNFPTHAQRGGWIAETVHRDRLSGRHARPRSTPLSGAVSDFRLTLPARPENVTVARHMLTCVTRVLGMPGDVSEDVRLAVTEACTNVVRHAYEEGEGAIEVTVRPHEGSLEVVVADEGRGMGPSPDTDGPGLGLPLITALAKTVELRPGRRGGSRIAMSFPLGHA